MLDETRSAVEEAIMIALVERLEAALELGSGIDAASRLEEVGRLCEEAAKIAFGGALLLA